VILTAATGDGPKAVSSPPEGAPTITT